MYVSLRLVLPSDTYKFHDLNVSESYLGDRAHSLCSLRTMVLLVCPPPALHSVCKSQPVSAGFTHFPLADPAVSPLRSSECDAERGKQNLFVNPLLLDLQLKLKNNYISRKPEISLDAGRKA